MLSPPEYFKHPFHSIIDTEPNTPTEDQSMDSDASTMSPQHRVPPWAKQGRHTRVLESQPHRSQLCGPRPVT